jgi:hypothetical protein
MVGLRDPFAPMDPTGGAFGPGHNIAQALTAVPARPRTPAVPPPQPRVLYNSTTGQMAAGGVVFDERDIGTLTRVPELLARPQAPDPEGMGWQPVSLQEVEGYLSSLGERRGFLSNVGLGVRQTAQGLVSGIGRGLNMAGAEGLGDAFVAAGEAVGPDEFEQQRSALIYQNSTMFEKILDAAAQGIPSFVTSMIGGGAGALAVRGGARLLGMTATSGAKTAGALAGSAATIFPMELESSYQAALQGGYDVNDPQVNQEMLEAAFAKTIAQTLVPAYAGRTLSAKLTGEINELGQRAAKNAMQRAFSGRTGQAAGGALVEAFAEGFAELIDRTSFDPEFRRMLSAGDMKALAPYIYDRHGESIAVAAGAGAFLGGGAGAVFARPNAAAPQDGPQDLLANPPGQGPAPLGEMQGPAPLGEMQGPRLEDFRQGPAPLGAMQGPAPLGAMQGPRLEDYMQGPAPLGAMQGPAPLGEMQGPMPLGPMQGPAPLGEMQGPAPLGAIQGPMPLGPMQGPMPLGEMQGPPAPITLLRGNARQAAVAEPNRQIDNAQTIEIARARNDQLLRRGAAARAVAIQGAQADAAVDAQATLSAAERARARVDRRESAAATGRADEEAVVSRLTEQGKPASQLIYRNLMAAEQRVEEADRAFRAARDSGDRLQQERAGRELAEAQTALTRLRDRLEPTGDIPPAAPTPTSAPASGARKLRRAARPKPKPTPTPEPTPTPKPTPKPNARKPSAQQVALTGRYKSLTPQQKAAVNTELGVTDAAGVAEAIATRPNDVEAAINNATQQPPPTPPKPTRKGRKPGEPKAAAAPKPAPKAEALKVRPAPKAEAEAARKAAPPVRTQAQIEKEREDARKQDIDAVIERLNNLTEDQALAVVARLDTQLDPFDGDVEAYARVNPEGLDNAIDAVIRVAPARRSAEDIEADRQRVAAAREAVAQRAQPRGPTTVAPPLPSTVAEGATPAEILWSELRNKVPDPSGIPDYADLTDAGQKAWDKAVKTKKFRDSDDRYKGKQLQKVVKDDAKAQRGPVSDTNSLNNDPDDALGADAATDLAGMIDGFNSAVVDGYDPYKVFGMTEAQFNTRFEELVDIVRVANPKARLGRAHSPLLTTFLKEDGTPNVTETGTMMSTAAPLGGSASGRMSLADFTSGRDVVDLDNKPLKPMASGQAKLVVTKFLSKFAVKPNVSYFADQADLKRKAPELYQRAVAARPQGDFDTANAAAYFFDGNNVIIFTDRIVTADQLRTAIAHEALGHMGIRAVIPEGQVTATMEMLYNSDEGLARIVDERVAALGQSRAEATEEYLSDMAARIDTNMLIRWWNAVKDALNKLGLRFRDDEARYLLRQSRRYLRTGERSSFFDPVRMANDSIEVNLGNDPDGNGRFTLAGQQQSGPLDLSRIAADRVYAAQEGPANVYEAASFLRDYSTRGKNLMTNALDMLDSFNAQVIVPTQWRAQISAGFSKMFDLIRQRQQIASELVVKFQQMRNIPLRPRAEYLKVLGAGAINPKSKAISSAGLTKVGSALAANRIVKSFRYKLPRDMRNQKLLNYNTASGEYTRNKDLIKTLIQRGRLTREEFARGVDVSIEQLVPMTDAFRQQLADERNTLLAGLTDQKEIDRINAEYDALMKSPNFMQTSERKETITFTDVEWQAFEQELDVLAEAEILRLESIFTKYNDERSNTFEILKRSMKEPMTKGDRDLIDSMVVRYYEIAYGNVDYNEAGMRIAASVNIKSAEKFAETLNKVILDAEKVDALFGTDGFLADNVRDTVAEQIKGLKSRLNLPKKTGDTGLDQGRFVVQNQVKQLANQYISTTDAERSAIRNLSTGYVPFTREGEFQVSMVAMGKDGKEYTLAEEYRDQLVYMQFESRPEARAAEKLIADLFGDRTFPMRVFDPTADEGRGAAVAMDVRLVPKVGGVKRTSTSDPELNLNESIRFLRRFSINLTPGKTEDVIVALMNQNDRAFKRRLKAAFVPGQSRDMTKAISQHLETIASVIARNNTAVELGNVLDLSLPSTRELWYGSQEKYDRLKAKYERLKATPGVNSDALSLAEQEFSRYHSQFVVNNAPENAMRHYNEARKLPDFLDQQKTVMETDVAAGPIISRIRFFTSVALLGGSFATGSLNVVGFGTNTPAALAYRNKDGFGGGFGMSASVITLARAYKMVGWPGLSPSKAGREYTTSEFYKSRTDAQLKKMGMTRNEAEFLAEGVDRGDFRAAQFDALRGSARGNITSGAWQAFLDGWMFWFTATEQSTRRATGLASYRLEYNRRINAGQSVGEADAAAKKFAYDMVNFTLGDYTTGNRPAFFRGGPQQFLFMFKQFVVNSAVLLKALPWKGRMMMGLSLIILSGLRGLPGAEDLEDLVDTLMQKMGLKTASVRAWGIKELDKIAPGLGQVVVSGVVNRYLAGDAGVRTALGNIVPGTGFGLAGADPMREFMEILGPLGSTAKSTLATLDNIIAAANPNTPGSWGTVLRNTPFTMLNAWSDAYTYAQNGAIVDKRGYVVSRDYDVSVLLARIIGFYPRAASDQYEAIRMSRRISDYQREISIGYRDAAVRAIVKGDRAEVRRIFEDVRAWNQSARGTGLEIQNFGDRVQRAVKAQRLLASERLLNASPISSRARMREIMESLGTY